MMNTVMMNILDRIVEMKTVRIIFEKVLYKYAVKHQRRNRIQYATTWVRIRRRFWNNPVMVIFFYLQLSYCTLIQTNNWSLKQSTRNNVDVGRISGNCLWLFVYLSTFIIFHWRYIKLFLHSSQPMGHGK